MLLAGWGLIKTTIGWEKSKSLKLHNLQVNPEEICDEIFGPENLKDNGIPIFQMRRRLPYGFTNDISCVGNEWIQGVSFYLTLFYTIQIRV